MNANIILCFPLPSVVGSSWAAFWRHFPLKEFWRLRGHNLALNEVCLNPLKSVALSTLAVSVRLHLGCFVVSVYRNMLTEKTRSKQSHGQEASPSKEQQPQSP